MFEKLSDNLNMLMEEAHISADELGRRTGVPASTIKKIRNRYSPNPTLATLVPLAHFFSISISQLVGDESFSKDLNHSAIEVPERPVRAIPLVSWLDVVNPSRSSHPTVITDIPCSAEAYALQVEEDDWKPFPKDTVLIVDPLLTSQHRDFVILHKIDQRAPTLKQILFDEGAIYIKPLIEGYPLLPMTDQYRILGVVVEYKKRLRMI